MYFPDRWKKKLSINQYCVTFPVHSFNFASDCLMVKGAHCAFMSLSHRTLGAFVHIQHNACFRGVDVSNQAIPWHPEQGSHQQTASPLHTGCIFQLFFWIQHTRTAWQRGAALCWYMLFSPLLVFSFIPTFPIHLVSLAPIQCKQWVNSENPPFFPWK